MLVLVYMYLHAQSKPDAVGDVQPVEGMTAKLGHHTAVTTVCFRKKVKIVFVC